MNRKTTFVLDFVTEIVTAVTAVCCRTPPTGRDAARAWSVQRLNDVAFRMAVVRGALGGQPLVHGSTPWVPGRPRRCRGRSGILRAALVRCRGGGVGCHGDCDAQPFMTHIHTRPRTHSHTHTNVRIPSWHYCVGVACRMRAVVLAMAMLDSQPLISSHTYSRVGREASVCA